MNLSADILAAALKAPPQGAEFRFLDRLNSLQPGHSGEGEYRVRGDEPFLKGNFPGQPVFPGVLLIEAAAQLAGVVAQSGPGAPSAEGFKLTGIRAVKIFGSAQPGETIYLQAEINGRLGNLIQATAQAFVAGQVVMTGEFTLSGKE